MTLRINRRETPDGVVIELHGWLNKEVVREFTSLCDLVGHPLLIDLSHLLGIDDAGLAAMQSRIARGADVEDASPYIRLLLDPGPVAPKHPKQ